MGVFLYAPMGVFLHAPVGVFLYAPVGMFLHASRECILHLERRYTSIRQVGRSKGSVTEITSRSNPLIKEYIGLRDSKRARREQLAFVLEGARLIEDAIGEGVGIKYCFFSGEAAKKHESLVLRLERLTGGRAYKISDSLCGVLSDTSTSQGIFAAASALDKFNLIDKIKYGGKYMVLRNLQDPGNVGTIVRAADAVGLDGIFLCGCADIYNPKTVRSTMGSMFRIPFDQSAEYSALVMLMKDSGLVTYASVVDGDAVDLRENTFEDACAIVIGNEGRGLSDGDTALCDKRITIKMKGNIDSLNAATAASIFLWELTK